MQNESRRMRSRPLRMRSGNHLWCLLCYLIAFAVPLLWQFAALRLIYPYKLYATAPDVAAHLLDAFPKLENVLAPIAALTADQPSALMDVLAAREQVWLGVLTLTAAAAWLVTLLIQLLWRVFHRTPILSARATTRAVRSYRITMLLIWLVNAAAAGGLWLYGVQYIHGRTLWDYAVCFGVFVLLPLSAAVVSRLAASPMISGRHAFFKRILF